MQNNLITSSIPSPSSIIPGNPMAKETIYSTKKRSFRGITMIETLLALTIGGMIFASSVYGINRYNQGIKIQSASSLLSNLSKAAKQYASDNYQKLLAAAPQNIPIDVLEPYFAGNIGTDAFRTEYYLTSNTYTFPVPDGAGGTIMQPALQLLLVGQQRTSGLVPQDETIRSDIANTAGIGAGFISTNRLSCLNKAGTAKLPAGSVCGVFDAYSFTNAQFPAANLANAAYVALVAEGDASLYGDELYRYDYGDIELNTMHTDIHMDDNDMPNTGKITGVDKITFQTPVANAQEITTTTTPLNITTADDGDLVLEPGNGILRFIQDGTTSPIIKPAGDTLQIGDNDELVSVGPLQDDTIKLAGTADTVSIGSENATANDLVSKSLTFHEINSLHEAVEDPLRLQNFHNGEVVVGKRVSYTPSGTSARYDISDGKITTQTISVQDIECADCGGSLANLLPKWRHIGTYFVKDQAADASGVIIPKPDCSNSRRSQTVRLSTGEDASFDETNNDPRYEPKIVLIPKKFGYLSHNDTNPLASDKLSGVADADHVLGAKPIYSFYARDYSSTEWIAYPNVYNGFKNGTLSSDTAADTSYSRDSVVPGTTSSIAAINPSPASSLHDNYVIWEDHDAGSEFFYPSRLEHYSVATALALTFCYFNGGEDPDPSHKTNSDYRDIESLINGYQRIE